jgi:hypothetical protein
VPGDDGWVVAGRYEGGAVFSGVCLGGQVGGVVVWAGGAYFAFEQCQAADLVGGRAFGKKDNGRGEAKGPGCEGDAQGVVPGRGCSHAPCTLAWRDSSEPITSATYLE